MRRNEDYFAGPAKIENYCIQDCVSDDNAKALQLQSGELNLAQVTPKDAREFCKSAMLIRYMMMKHIGLSAVFCIISANEYWQENADLIPAY